MLMSLDNRNMEDKQITLLMALMSFLFFFYVLPISARFFTFPSLCFTPQFHNNTHFLCIIPSSPRTSPCTDFGSGRYLSSAYKLKFVKKKKLF